MTVGNSCGAFIKQIHDALEKSANNALRHQDLTMAQVGVLLALNDASDHELPLKELEQVLRVAQSTAAGIVTRLEQNGLPRRELTAAMRQRRSWRVRKGSYYPA